jgi:hypothetical protein
VNQSASRVCRGLTGRTGRGIAAVTCRGAAHRFHLSKAGSGRRFTLTSRHDQTGIDGVARMEWERALWIPQSHSVAEPAAGRKPLSGGRLSVSNQSADAGESGLALPVRD